MRPRVLFQGSFADGSLRKRSITELELDEHPALALPIAEELGSRLIEAGFDLILTGATQLDHVLGESAVAACERLKINPRDRIRTYPHGDTGEAQVGFGMVLQPADKRWQEVRTFVVAECDAVIALIGGKGTSDCLQKAVLAKKPVFPIPTGGGASKLEWDRLRAARHRQPGGGDLEFLGDQSLSAANLSSRLCEELGRLLRPRSQSRSRRIFIVHGHDGDLKNHLARLLNKLDLLPIILAEQPEKGQALYAKLHAELSDIAFAFVLYTADDVGAPQDEPDKLVSRARQNVLFEHGMLLGLLGPERVCVIVRGDVEIPSDLKGLVVKMLQKNSNIDAIAFDIARELAAAGYAIDANKLLSDLSGV